mmetsp:Transcript_22707/g.69398  ORF Transcript_22707/g.69398 Transcript_22707/m.69398 type:complete len:93 (-) Transcript_22707:474-752(-)
MGRGGLLPSRLTFGVTVVQARCLSITCQEQYFGRPLGACLMVQRRVVDDDKCLLLHLTTVDFHYFDLLLFELTKGMYHARAIRLEATTCVHP